MSIVPFTALVRIANGAETATLSSAQTQFNVLVETLEARRESLAEWQKAQHECLQQTVRVWDPLRHTILVRQQDCVEGLYAQLAESPSDSPFTRNERRWLERAVCDLAKPLIAQTGNVHIKAIYNQYSSVDYDEEVHADAAHFKIMLSDVYGLNMTQAKGQTREELLDHARRQLAMEQDRAERRRDRRKERLNSRETTPVEQAKEAAQRHRADQTQQTIREVYRKLASALHPDREPDEMQRSRKTALMTRVNMAYDKKELLELLSLQLELAHIDADNVGNLSSERLAHYNKLLKEQLADIDRELAQMESAIRFQLQLPPATVLTASTALPILNQRIAKAQLELQATEDGLSALKDVQTLKRWLKSRE